MPRPVNVDPERLSRAILEAISRKGTDQTSLAKAVGVSHAALSDWIRMKKRPGTENLGRLLDVLGLPLEDVLRERGGEEKRERGRAEERGSGGKEGGGIGSEGGGVDGGAGAGGRLDRGEEHPPALALAGRREGVLMLPDPALLEDLVLVPRIARGRAADLLRHGGYVNPAEGEIEGYDAFSRSEAQRLSGGSADDLYTVTVVGDSLLPEIPPGTRVAYVPRDRIDDHGLYVILVDDGVLVKRVQRYAGGAIEIIPINEAYSREMLMPLEDADTGGLYRSQQTGLTAEFRVIGKVVFYPKAA